MITADIQPHVSKAGDIAILRPWPRSQSKSLCKKNMMHRAVSLRQHGSYCWTSHLPGLLRLHFFYHPRPAKSWVSPRLTGAMVPPRFHLRTFLHARPSFRQLPWGRGLGSVVGTIVQRNEDFVDYMARTSLSGRRLLLAFTFTRLDFDKE